MCTADERGRVNNTAAGLSSAHRSTDIFQQQESDMVCKELLRHEASWAKFTFQLILTYCCKNEVMLLSPEQGKSSDAQSEGAHLERFLSCVYELMPLQLRALNEGFTTFCADVHTWPVGMQVLSHRRVVPEHLGTSLRGRDTR